MPTVILIPGLLSDTLVWSPLARAVAVRFATRDVDLSEGNSITEWARRILEETPGPIIAVGHSMGGRVALEMAHQAPDRVVGLILANTGHHPRREGEEVKRQEKVDLAHRDIEALIAEWLPPMLDRARTGDKDVLEPLADMVRRAGAQVHERQIQALLHRPDASAYLSEIRCPVLLIAARQDGWSPIQQHQEIAAAVADAELVVIENAGHFAPVERPDETIDAIVNWLDRRFPQI